MSDLRDFTPTRDDINTPRFEDTTMLTQPMRDDVVIVDDGGLGDLHIREDREEEGTSRNKLFAGLAVAVLVGIGGAYGVSQYMKDQPVVADNSLPQPSAPKTAAMTPPPAPAPMPSSAEETATPTPAAATAPAAPDVVKPAPVTKQAAATNAPKVMPMPKSSSSSSTASNIVADPIPAPIESTPAVTPPVQNQASNVPEPVSPTPPAAAFAGNPALNQQTAEPQADQVQAPTSQAAAPAEVTPAPAPAEATPAPAPVEAAPATPAQ